MKVSFLLSILAYFEVLFVLLYDLNSQMLTVASIGKTPFSPPIASTLLCPNFGTIAVKYTTLLTFKPARACVVGVPP